MFERIDAKITLKRALAALDYEVGVGLRPNEIERLANEVAKQAEKFAGITAKEKDERERKIKADWPGFRASIPPRISQVIWC